MQIVHLAGVIPLYLSNAIKHMHIQYLSIFLGTFLIYDNQIKHADYKKKIT